MCCMKWMTVASSDISCPTIVDVVAPRLEALNLTPCKQHLLKHGISSKAAVKSNL